MKVKSSKFLTGGLLSVISLAVVSSVASTFAWYTYNTKNGLAFNGITSGKTETLQVKLDSEDEDQWRTSISKDELVAESEADGYAGETLSPCTLAEGIEKDAALEISAPHGFYGAPVFGEPDFRQDNLKDDDGNYIFFRCTLNFRCVNPNDLSERYAKNIYISFLEIRARAEDDDDERDISSAIRIHLCQGTKNYLIAPAYDEDQALDLYGPLKLAGGEDNDMLPYDSDAEKYTAYVPGYHDEDDLVEIIYGNADAIEGAFGRNNTLTSFSGGAIDGTAGICVGTTSDNSETDDPLAISLTMTMWLEGWDPACINENFAGQFDLGIQFEVEAL